MSFLKRLFKTLLVILILAVFALAIWQNRAWIMENGQPLVVKIKNWAQKGTWNERGTFPATKETDSEHTNPAVEPIGQVVTASQAAAPNPAVETNTEESPAVAAAEEPSENEPTTSTAETDHPPAETDASTAAISDETTDSTHAHTSETEDHHDNQTTAQDQATTTVETDLIGQVRQQVWQGELNEARKTLLQAIADEPENPAYLWELMQLERYAQHFHQAARLQWRLQLLALKTEQEQQLAAMRQWLQQLDEQQTRLRSRIEQMEQELARTREELAQPLEIEP